MNVDAWIPDAETCTFKWFDRYGRVREYDLPLTHKKAMSLLQSIIDQHRNIVTVECIEGYLTMIDEMIG